MTVLRVLQVIGDSDADEEAAAAIALHSALAARGVEVRTLVLGPGHRGGLEVDLPVISHGRRSLAARTALARERRWADAVIHRGIDAWMVMPRPSSAPAAVLALWNEPVASVANRPPRWLGRALRRSDAVVRTWSAGSDPDETQTGPATRVIAGCAPADATTTTPAARRAAKRELGLDSDTLTVRSVGPSRSHRSPNDPGEARLLVAHACATVGAAYLDAFDDAVPSGGPAGADRAELVAAAADVVVSPFATAAGPAPDLLAAIVAGSVPLAARVGAVSALLESTAESCLLDPDDPGPSLEARLATLTCDVDLRHSLADAAQGAVAQSCSAPVVAQQWETLLHRVVGQRRAMPGSTSDADVDAGGAASS